MEPTAGRSDAISREREAYIETKSASGRPERVNTAAEGFQAI
jgi:hypothetical protein